MVQIIEEEGVSLPVQCVTNPTGVDRVRVYEYLTYAFPSFYTPTRITQPEELSLQVQYETARPGVNGVVVYDDLTYALPSLRHRCYHCSTPLTPPDIDENHQPPNGALSVYNSTGASGVLEQQWSLEETYNQDENLLFRPHGHLTSGGRQLSPFYRRETTVPNTWWSRNGPWVVMTLGGVMISLFIFVIAKQT